MADETQKTLIDITALKYFYKSLQNVTVLIAPSSIEAASASNLGRTYFIPVDGTYAGINCSKGDHIVSNGVAWILIPKGTSEGGKEYFAGTGIDISTVDGKDVISNTGVRKIAKADENHPGTIKVSIGNNNPEYIEVAGLDTAAFMPYEVELTEDSDDAIPTSKAVADYVADEIADLSVADSEVEGQYVASVAQEDGKITIIRQDLPTPKDTYDATSSEAISGKGVADAIKAKQDSLSADQMSAVNSGITADLKANYDTAYAYSQETHARVDATKVEASETNGKIKINDVETTVYTHPGTGTNPHGTTKADVGLSNVGNFKAVSTVASQGLTETEKANAKANLGISDASSMGVDTSITASASNNKVPTSKAIKDYVDTEIENLPEPMIFKGSVGTGGTITSLPTAAKANMGFTYKVITAGTYASQSAKVGDTFISTGTAWELIPSGDEPSGTVTSVGVSVPTGLSVSGTPVTTSGTIAISMASGYSIPTTAKQEAWDGKSVVAKSDTNGSIKINGTDTVVYTHPTGTNPHGTTKSDVGLGNVGNFKAVSTVASQGLTNTEKSNARANIGAGTGNGTYSKPSGGIPATDLASAVQTSLGKADTALQSHQSLEDYVKTTDSRLTDARASNDVQAYAKTGSGITVAKSVPSDAKFTDTTYSAATTSANGLMSSSDKTKLNGIATGATAVSESTVSGWGFTKNAGTVTSVKVGTTSYSPSSGVVSLPAYPTSLPASNTTNSYSATGTVPVSGTAVAAAIGGLDVTGTTAFGAGKTISAWSETDGKISITSQNISITKSQISDFPSSMTPTAHNQASSTITAMTGYSKASAASAIAATDSLNTAIGKLEKALDGKAASSHNQASNTITAMTGYSKASSASAITTSDSLNTAVGKLEKKVDDKVQKTSVSSANKTTSTIAIDDNSQMAMVAKISGKTQKNILVSKLNGSGSTGGVNWTVNSDGSITLDTAGKASTARCDLWLAGAWASTTPIYSGTSFTMSISVPQSSTYNGVALKAINNTTSKADVSNVRPVTSVSSAITGVYVTVDTGKTLSNYRIYPMILEGTVSNPKYTPAGTLCSAAVESVVSQYLYSTKINYGYGLSTDGSVGVSANRSVTDLITIKNNVLEWTLKSKTKTINDISIHGYNSSNVHIYDSGWVANNGKFYLSNTSITKVRLLFRYSDNANMVADDVVLTVGTNKTTVLVPSAVKNLPDYGLGIVQSDGKIVANEVDFENGVYYHRVSLVALDGAGVVWSVNSADNRFVTTDRFTNLFKRPSNNTVTANILCSKWNSQPNSASTTGISYNTVGILGVYGSGYTTRDTFTEAVKGVSLIGELATPETIPLTDYLRPLPVENGGTLTLVNEHNLDMPSVIKYKKEV